MVDFCFFFQVCTRGACIQPLEQGGGDGSKGAGADIAPLLTGMDYKMEKAVFRLSQLRKLLHYIHTTHGIVKCHGRTTTRRSYVNYVILIITQFLSAIMVSFKKT